MSGNKHKWWGNERETAELIWCAAHLRRIFAPPSSQDEERKKLSASDRGLPAENYSEDVVKTPPDFAKEIEPRIPLATHFQKSDRSSTTSPTKRDSSSSDRASPIRIPDPFPLPKPASISKALLPLAKRVPGILANELDIDATVEQTAEANGLPIMAFRPPLERWFEVHLLVDRSPPMEFWGDLAEGVANLFRWQGFFRDVRIWNFDTRTSEPRLFSGAERIEREIRSLIAPSRNRLFVLLTDTLGKAWHSGRAFAELAVLGEQHPVTIAHVFPPTLWQRTALHQSILRPLVALQSGCANSKLKVGAKLRTTGSLYRFPIFNLSPDHFATWANFLAGSGGNSIQGVLIRQKTPMATKGESSEGVKNKSEVVEKTPEHLLRGFLTDASPQARKLAKVLAAVPLIPPVMRLAQRQFLPDSEHWHLAEVFFSGLLQRSPLGPTEKTVPETWYEFRGGIRELLLENSPVQRTAEIWREIGDFIQQHYGSLRDFQALVPNPEGSIRDKNINLNLYFAEVEAAVLMTWGGEYASRARELQAAVSARKHQIEVFSRRHLKSILLVEDKQKVIEEISKVLSSQYGIAVTGTDDVDEVIKLVKSGEIDLILINYDLPNSRYQGTKVNGIEIVRLLREQLNIADALPIIGFSILVNRKGEFLQYADGFYDRNKAVEEEAEQDFINYLRKIFNRVKLLELLPYESAEDLDSVLEFISKRNLESRDTSEEDVSSLWNKPKGDVGTFYLLENLRLLDVLVMTASGKGPGTIRYDLSQSYLNQNSPRPYPPPDGDKFDERFQQLPFGQKELLDFIKPRSELKQDTSLADAAVPHPQEEDIATYRRLENLRLLGFLSITDLGTSRETIRYNLSQKYQEYLGLGKGLDLPTFTFETVTVNGRGEIIHRETHNAQYYTESLPNNVSLDLVAIPGGTFTMGSPENEGSDDERPQHEVTVSGFFMGKYPITQAQWQAIASQDDLKVEIDLNPEPSNFKGDNRPVETVNWYEAVEFCQRLSKLTGSDYRLPSEAEWEYACRAVTSDQLSVTSEELTVEEWNEKYHQPFYFGETITAELANYNASSTYADEPKGEKSKKTTPVGQFPPNAFGLYDLHGNVWEWCADDWHDNYEDAPTDGSAWLSGNDNRSPLRGGSWDCPPEICRSASRYYIYRRVLHFDDVGFRVVCGFGRTL